MADNRKSQAEKAASGKNSAKGNSVKNSAPKNSKTSAKATEPVKNERDIPRRFISAAIFLALFIVFLVICLNPEGAIIEFLQPVIMGLVGQFGFIVSIPALLYLFCIHAFSGRRPVKLRSICVFLIVIICGGLSHLALSPENMTSGLAVLSDLYTGGVENTTGGLLCGAITMLLEMLLGTVLTYILYIVGAFFALLGAMQITIPSIIRAVKNRPRAEWEDEAAEEQPDPAAIVVNHIATKRIEYVEQKRSRAAQEVETNQVNKPEKNLKEKADSMMRQIDIAVDTPVSAAAVSPGDEEEEIVTPDMPDILPIAEQPKVTAKDVHEPAEEIIPEKMPDLELNTATPVTVRVVKPKKVTPKEAETAAVEVEKEIAAVSTEPKVEYCYPPIDLLLRSPGSTSDGISEMRENSQRLNETLASFKIEAHIINVTRGPSVTRYEVELEKGVRLSKLTSAADDIALSLGASGVRIAAVPGKISVVGIEVPNKAVTMVSLREVIDSSEFTKAKSKSSFAVGKDIGGNCIVGNIAKLPHMLIAGTTGSGKSVCMNSVIISLLYKASPDEVKLIMVDPKMVELGIYNGIPHLLIPVVTDPKKAAGSLQWAVTEMMRRYKAMSDAGVRDLESYNAIMQRENGAKLPSIVVIIDELADLMLVAAKEVEESICRIAQMGRAAGIHLIIATQRPSADVITGLMKANIPSRIAFAVASAMESRIILDTQGAEKLVGRGDMLYAPIGNGKPRRIQGCFVTDQEVEAVASYVKNNFTTSYDQEVMEEIERKAAQTGSKPAATNEPEPTAEELDGDEMLPAAVDVILETGQASVSMLQRRLKLGYARAARIVDEMEEKGIVGPFQGSKPRAILINKDQWSAMRDQGAAQMNFDDLESEDCEELEE